MAASARNTSLSANANGSSSSHTTGFMGGGTFTTTHAGAFAVSLNESSFCGRTEIKGKARSFGTCGGGLFDTGGSTTGAASGAFCGADPVMLAWESGTSCPSQWEGRLPGMPPSPGVRHARESQSWHRVRDHHVSQWSR
eukprot:Opistho-2@70687